MQSLAQALRDAPEASKSRGRYTTGEILTCIRNFVQRIQVLKDQLKDAQEQLSKLTTAKRELDGKVNDLEQKNQNVCAKLSTANRAHSEVKRLLDDAVPKAESQKKIKDAEVATAYAQRQQFESQKKLKEEIEDLKAKLERQEVSR